MAAHEHSGEACPPLSDLMLAGTRELPAADLHRIEAHVASCAACQQWVDCADALVEAYAVLELDIETPAPALVAASAPRNRAFLVRRLLQGVAMAAAAILLFLLASRSEPLQAKDLLDRAMASERQTPHTFEQIVNIRITPIPAFGPASSNQSAMESVAVRRRLRGGVVASPAVTSGVPPDLKQGEAYANLAELALRAYRFDWNRPLKLHSFQEWRAALAHKEDVVDVRGDTIVLRTTAGEGVLHQAELFIHSKSYHVVALKLTFELGQLMVEEIEQSAEPLPEPSSMASSAETSPSPHTPSPPSIVRAPPLPPPIRPALSRWLDQQYTSQADARRFIHDLESVANDMQHQLRDVRELSVRYPRHTVDRLGSDERADVERQVTIRYEKVRSTLDVLDERLGVLFGTRTLPTSSRQSRIPADWRERITVGQAHADKLKTMLATLLMREDLPPADDPLGARGFATTFDALWTAINATNATDRAAR